MTQPMPDALDIVSFDDPVVVVSLTPDNRRDFQAIHPLFRICKTFPYLKSLCVSGIKSKIRVCFPSSRCPEKRRYGAATEASFRASTPTYSRPQCRRAALGAVNILTTTGCCREEPLETWRLPGRSRNTCSHITVSCPRRPFRFRVKGRGSFG